MPATLRAHLTELVTEARGLSDGPAAMDADAVLRRLIDPLPFTALVADNDGRYVAANRAASVLTGYGREELLNLSVWNLTPPTGQRDTDVLWRAFLQQREQTGDYVLIKKNGQALKAVYAARAHFLPGRHLSLIRDETPGARPPA
ncbi:MAG TPA: PAS domain-containing protein [Vicinamibacterales bacterium]|nr:PAS domain-containing protein [Vicinamibacterales bacterium]